MSPAGRPGIDRRNMTDRVNPPPSAWCAAGVLLLPALAATGLWAAPSGTDWPQWMGALGDGTAAAAETFPGGARIELRERWRRLLGRGYSSVSVVGDRAYTLFSDGSGEVLIAIDVRDGHQLWRHDLARDSSSQPLSTPAVDGDRVFAISARGQLHAVDAADGRLLWARDLGAELGASVPTYGISTSPTVVDGLLVVLAGGAKEHNLVAFDASSGEIAWSVFHAGLTSYSSPVAGTLGGQRQIVVPAGDRLYAVRPGDGRLLWSLDDLGYPDRNPLLLPGDRVFLPLETHAVMVRIERNGNKLRAVETWRSESLWFSYSPAVYLDGSIYGFGKEYLTCLDADSGAVRWRERLTTGSLILVDRHLLVLDSIRGGFRVIAADPEAFDERAAKRVFDPGVEAFAPPSFAAGTIFLRNHQEVVALDVVPEGPAR